jgi:hypothetical protein
MNEEERNDLTKDQQGDWIQYWSRHYIKSLWSDSDGDYTWKNKEQEDETIS